jgi:Kef-type K+ transport system membrane component KefB
MDFFIPVFFIMVGMRIKLETIMQPESWLLAAILTAVAFASKLLCFVGIRKETKTLNIDPWIVAFGMLPRGLPGLVFATVALNSGFISDTLFAGLIIMVTATNTIGLTLLSYRLKSQLL